MSFKNDYKSALRSASPDTEKIIAEVHERLSENAPLKIRTEQKKKRPLWQIIAPVAGAAACVALCIIFIPKFFGFPLSNTGGMNNAGDMNGAGGSPEHIEANESDNLNGGIEIRPENNSQVTTDNSSGNSWQSAEFEIVRSDDGDMIEVVQNGTRYFRTDKVRAYEISEKYDSVIQVDGKSYYVILQGNDDIIYLVEDTSAWAYAFEKMSVYVNGKDLSNIDIMLITNENKETRVILGEDGYIKTGESFYLKTLPDSAARFSSGGIKYLICGNGHRVMVVDTDTYSAQYYTKESEEVIQSEVIINESITVTQ